MDPGGIPEDKLPPCWSDEVRMNALFAPFRLKAANPESWDMKMKFWSDMMRVWCRAKGEPLLSAADAKVAFQRKGRTPACIDIVVEEMLRSGELVPLSKYQNVLQGGSEGWVRWGARLAFKPAALAITAVSSLLPGRQQVDSDGLPKASIDSTQKFVLEEVLKEQASSFLSSFPEGEPRVGPVWELAARAGRSAQLAELLAARLLADGRATVRDHLVKLAEPSGRVSPVSESERALARLRAAEARLRGELARLARDAAAAAADARAALQRGNKTAAKGHLRRKLAAGARLARCERALDTVAGLQHQLAENDQNTVILDTYKTATSAMKRDMRENNLAEDAVHHVLDDLNEVMESYSEVERALSGGSRREDGEEADLEAELERLLAPARGDHEATAVPPPPAALPPLPSPPEFVYDGEERILAELGQLGLEDSAPPPARPARPARPAQTRAQREKEIDDWTVPGKGARDSQPWYPPADEWNNNYAEIRTDDRLHPGQTLDVDFGSAARLYARDFLVQDHRPQGRGVWLYRGPGGADHASSESSDNSGSTFQMAPGGERRRGAGNQPTAAFNQPAAACNQPTAACNQPTAACNQPTAACNQPAAACNQPTAACNQPTAACNQPTAACNQPTAGNQDVASNQSDVGGNQPAASAGDFDDLERRLKNLRGFNL